MNTKHKISTIPASDLQKKSGAVLHRVAVAGEHLLIERNGYPMAVIVPIGDYQALTEEHTDQ